MNPDQLLAASKPITLDAQELCGQYFRQYPQQVCEMAFSQLFLWGESRDHRYCELEGHLVTSFQKRGESRIFYPPIGPDPATLIRETMNPKEGFSFLYVPENVAVGLQSLHLVETPERFDYVYETSVIRALYGKKYESHRNNIRKCMAQNPEIAQLSGKNKEECLALLHRWLEKTQAKPYANSVLDEISALTLAMENFEMLQLMGVGLRFNGQLEALAIGAPLNGETVVEHFEKSSGAFPGLYQCVFHEFAKTLPESFKFINKEEDLGIPGLQQAKQGWHPVMRVKKYTIVA